MLRAISGRIINDIAPAFHQAGVATYWVYWPRAQAAAGPQAGLKNLDERVRLQPGDRVLPKYNLSAFAQTDFNSQTPVSQALADDDAKLLFVSGIFQTQCVAATVSDARHLGYEVVALVDAMDGPAYDHLKFQERMATGIHLRWDTSLEAMENRKRAGKLQEWRDNGVLITRAEDVLAVLPQLPQARARPV